MKYKLLLVESGGTGVATVIVSIEAGTCYLFSQHGPDRSRANIIIVTTGRHLTSSQIHPPPVRAPVQAGTRAGQYK